MAEWKEISVKEAPFEIIDGDRGINYPSQDEFYDEGYCLFLSTRNVRQTGFNFSDCQFITQEKDELLRKGKLRRNDTVLTTRGTVGNLAFYGNDVPFENIRINSGMIIVRPDVTKMEAIFCYYIFRYMQKSFETFTSGSAQPQLPIRDLNEMEISLPDLREQRSIASILGSLDDKIDLLHRQNKTLEALAETLFRQRFVEEANDGWEVGKLGDVISIYDSMRRPVSSMERDKMKTGQLYPYYGAATIMDYVNDYIFDGEYILMGEDGTVQTEDGYPILQLPTGKFWVNNHTHILQAKEPYSNFFMYIFLKKTNIAHIVTGAVQPKINQENLKSIEFPISPVEKVETFVSITNDFWNKMNSNNSQITSLTQMRDKLLPKLMSGEVRVKIN
jgi:type I restriction enzyme S subunit